VYWQVFRRAAVFTNLGRFGKIGADVSSGGRLRAKAHQLGRLEMKFRIGAA
jgi:hypothetical protein